jgi:hypothetical protein
LPPNTPDRDYIYIAGNFNGWDPGDPRFRLTRGENGLLEISIPRKIKGDYYNAFEYKFTRGSWKSVETTFSGMDISNRSYIFGNRNEVDILIDGWHDQTSKIQ